MSATHDIWGGGPIRFSWGIQLRLMRGSSVTQEQVDALVAELEAKYGKGEWHDNIFKIPLCDIPSQ